MSDAKLKKAPQLYQWGLRFPKTVLCVFLVASLISIFMAGRLKIDNDLVSLLPKNSQSIQSLDNYKAYFGGTTFLMVTVESDNPALNEQFADLMVKKIETHPGIMYVDFRRPIDYFKKRQWLFLDQEDLDVMNARVLRALELEKQGVSFMFNKYMDFADENDRPDLTFSDILEKYKKKKSTPSKVGISDKEGNFLVIRIKVKPETTQFENARRLVDSLKQDEIALKKDNEIFNQVNVGYTGNLQKNIEKNDSIKEEMLFVSAVVFISLALILYLYFKTFESIILVGLPLLFGILCTGGIVTPLLERLNVLTSFAGGILAGLGSDYGIYLLHRYYTERRSGKDFNTAIRLAFAHTGSATYGSMLTTVGAFVALMFSNFGLFKEFGVVGAIGVILNYICMVLVIPALLTLWHHQRHKAITPPKSWSFFTISPKAKISNLIKKLLAAHPIQALFIGVFICLLGAMTVPTISSINYEEGLLENQNIPSQKLMKKVNRAVKESLNPTVVLVHSEQEEHQLVDAFTTLLKNDDQKELVYNNVVGLSTFIPDHVQNKKERLKEIATNFQKLKYMPQAQKEDVAASLKDSILSDPPTSQTLPQEVKRLFVSSADPNTYAIYLYPSFGRVSKETLKKYQDGINHLKEVIEKPFIAADSSFAFDDILTLIEKESPRGFLLIVIFLTIVIAYNNRSLTRTLIVMGNLIGSLVLLSGVLWLTPIRLNVINLVAFPIILGTGIDAFIHFAQRFDEEGDLMVTLKDKIPAIAVSNLTSIVGFAGLILTSSTGLQSVGWVTTIGLGMVTLMCTFIFPRCLYLEQKKHKG